MSFEQVSYKIIFMVETSLKGKNTILCGTFSKRFLFSKVNNQNQKCKKKNLNIQ